MTTSFVSTLPPEPNNLKQDPIYLVQQMFVTYDEVGRIIHSGIQGRGFLSDRLMAGERVALGLGNVETHYVSAVGQEVIILPRLFLPYKPDRLDPKAREEITIPDLPPADVTFKGPTSGSLEHKELGDLKIGWTIPGEYTLLVESFPFLPQVFTVSVSKP